MQDRQGQLICLYSTVSRPAEAYPASYSNTYQGLSPGTKRPRNEAGHLPSANTEVKDQQSKNSTRTHAFITYTCTTNVVCVCVCPPPPITSWLVRSEKPHTCNAESMATSLRCCLTHKAIYSLSTSCITMQHNCGKQRTSCYI